MYMRDFGNEQRRIDMTATANKDFDNDDSDFGDITALSVTTKENIETTDGYFVGDGRYLTALTDTGVVTLLANSSGTVQHDYALGTVFVHTTPSANFTANITAVPTTPDRRLNVTVVVQQGVTPYAPTALHINGAAQTVQWVGGTPPSPTSLATDVYSYTLVRLGTTWTVLGTHSAHT
jgi:hypothetical protein